MDGCELTGVMGFDYETLVVDQLLRKFVNRPPPQICRFQRLHPAWFTRPRAAFVEEVHSMIHRFAPVRVAAMQHGQRLQFRGKQLDTKFFRSLPNGSVDRRLPQFDVARSSVSPVSVHESRALAQLQQHLAPLYRVASTEQHVHRWYQRKLIGHTTTLSCA